MLNCIVKCGLNLKNMSKKCALSSLFLAICVTFSFASFVLIIFEQKKILMTTGRLIISQNFSRKSLRPDFNNS